MTIRKGHPLVRTCRLWFAAGLLIYSNCFAAVDPVGPVLQIPEPGDNFLHILSPTVLELMLINTEAQGATNVDSWNWVQNGTNLVLPNMSSVRVLINGKTDLVTKYGFRRRPIYAPQAEWDLRIGNWLYMELKTSITNSASVQVTNNGTVWPTNLIFAATADPLRFNPAIHVNQEGYVPTFPKKAMVGFFIGNLGELPIATNVFYVVNAQSGVTNFTGTLTSRMDVGYQYTPTPYQQVYEADFSSFTNSGQYRLQVPGMGASLPFQIADGIAMDFARTYALGLFEQRRGFGVSMPYTRFTHAADHLTPASVPTNTNSPYAYTWELIVQSAMQTNGNNPPQTAPMLTNPAAQLYPFVNQRPVDVSGGHFDAGNYSPVAYDSAQLIHELMFAVDSLPGIAALDNLGIPESGDGIGDVLQEVKWEADFLAKMQDTDGGFYYAVFPIDEEYEANVLPENGEPQVVWPKNTSATGAAVAALAQCASSPHFKAAYPAAASNYWTKAQLGWKFLTNAFAQYGLNGAYQKLQGYGDDFTDNDERAWAACEMYLATGDPQIQQLLFQWFPDPTDPGTFKWGWWRMYASWGNAVRDYAMAVKSGRLLANQIDSNYLALCITTITNCGNDNLLWSQDNAYGSSFPLETKYVLGAGWYFSPEQAFDIVVAQQFNPNSNYVDAIIRNLNYEGGCNPINMTYVTGLGWKRQTQIVDQFSENFFTVLPKDGIPIGNIDQGFVWTFEYGYGLSSLVFPSDGVTNPYPMYDRWCDFFNVTTEASTTDDARNLITSAWLAAQTATAAQAWTYTNAAIIPPATPMLPGQPLSATLQVSDTNLSGARITWEALGQSPTFGGLSYQFMPPTNGPYWIEAEVQWPDGRRAFATNSLAVSTNNLPQLTGARILPGGFSFVLWAVPQQTCVLQASTNLSAWVAISTNTLPSSGNVTVTDPQAGLFKQRYYRAVVAH